MAASGRSTPSCNKSLPFSSFRSTDTSPPPGKEEEDVFYTTSDLPNIVMDASAYHSPIIANSYVPVGVLFIEGHCSTNWVSINERNINFLDIKHPLTPLIKADWVRGQIRGHESVSDLSLVRVFVLPEDVGRGLVLRDDRMLQKRLQEMMRCVDSTLDAWEGRRPVNVKRAGYQHYSEEDDSLFYLFNTIPSPHPQGLNVPCTDSQESIDSLFEPNGLSGLHTNLHPYQKRTAATMIRREVNPRKVLDPRLSSAVGPLGHRFYYDPICGRIYLNARTYDEVTGGVLAESMGLGKTLICLATVLATKGHWPSVPTEYSVGLQPVRASTGSLMQMVASAIAYHRIPWRVFFQRMSTVGDNYEDCLELLNKNVGSYKIPPPAKRHVRRPSTMPEPTLIYLCSATIIIVPQNLLSQWQREISQHFDENTFRVLVLTSTDSLLTPEASHILSYDIIIFTRQRFEQEMCPLNSRGFSRASCSCPKSFDCRCRADIAYRSPLHDLHFLRVIVDEGHEFGGRRNNAYFALSRLRVDRRWIVSGTPANGLLGVEVGSAAYEASETSTQKTKLELLEARKKEPAFLQECKDLEGLRTMVTGFLNLKPWSNAKHEDPANWGQYIVPYADGRRKPSSLRNLLSSVIVRHRIEDVEAEVHLPPLYNRVVYLDPSWQDKLSQNAFLLTLTVNAVTSERVDEDYMFHSKNRPVLQQLINNLRQSGFWWSSFSVEELSKTIKIATKYLEENTAQHKDGRSGDFQLLKRAIQAGEIILASPSWRVFSELHEIGLYVDDFPSMCRDAWSLVPRADRDPMLFGATQLFKVQKWIDTHVHEGEQLLSGLSSMGKTVMDKTWQELQHVRNRKIEEAASTGQSTSPQNSPSKRRNRSISIAQPRLTEHFTVSKSRSAGSHTTPKLSTETLGNPKPSSDTPTLPLKSALKPSKPVTLIDPESQLSRSALQGTASAKLSYLLDQITVLHKKEKTLIFFEGDHIAYYIAQAFDLIGVRYLIYTRTLDLALKSAYIATFNSTPSFRVMLMDLKEAAHGLHVASASRVFFVNPIWQPNIEAQAIKRAHRIGQVRPVYVETLVLRDTLEEEMLKRRRCMTVQEHQKAEKSVLDDEPMRAIIERAYLLPLSDEESSHARIQVARLGRPVKLFGQAGNKDVDLENPYADMIFPIETAKTKKLGLRKSKGVDVKSAANGLHVLNQRKRKSPADGFDTHEGILDGTTSTSLTIEHRMPVTKSKKRVGFGAFDDTSIETSPQVAFDSRPNVEFGPSTSNPVTFSATRVSFADGA